MDNLRTKLEEHCRFKPSPGTFGVEIETEVKNFEKYPEKFLIHNEETGRYAIPLLDEYFEGHKDNSLRNFGVEYVFKAPYDFDKALTALDAFASATAGIPFITDAPATSVHVHVNMLNDNLITLANFMTLYILFENVLVDYSGPTRRSNLFALPTRAANQTTTNISRMLENYAKGVPLGYDPTRVKYAALNLAPLMTQGSLEIRSFRGTTNVEDIKMWLRIINRLLVSARLASMTPSDILTFWRLQGMEFFDFVFSDTADELRSKVKDIEFLIEKNLWDVWDIASSVQNWKTFNETDFSLKKPDKKAAGLTLQFNNSPNSIYNLATLASTQALYINEENDE